jgi:hypothetical protein
MDKDQEKVKTSYLIVLDVKDPLMVSHVDLIELALDTGKNGHGITLLLKKSICFITLRCPKPSRAP